MTTTINDGRWTMDTNTNTNNNNNNNNNNNRITATVMVHRIIHTRGGGGRGRL